MESREEKVHLESPVSRETREYQEKMVLRVLKVWPELRDFQSRETKEKLAQMDPRVKLELPEKMVSTVLMVPKER